MKFYFWVGLCRTFCPQKLLAYIWVCLKSQTTFWYLDHTLVRRDSLQERCVYNFTLSWSEARYARYLIRNFSIFFMNNIKLQSSHFAKKNVSQIDSRPYYKWQLFGCRIILVNLWKIIWQVNDWPVFSLFKIRQIYLHAHDCSKCVISN